MVDGARIKNICLSQKSYPLKVAPPYVGFLDNLHHVSVYVP